MSDETAAQLADGHFNMAAQIFQGARASGMGLLRPLFQPAIGGTLALDPRLMAEEPEKGKVGIGFVLKHLLQVEFDIGLTGQALSIPQKTQNQSVGDDTPEMFWRVIQQFLYKAMRTGLPLSPVPSHTMIQAGSIADQMDGDTLLSMGDCITALT